MVRGQLFSALDGKSWKFVGLYAEVWDGRLSPAQRLGIHLVWGTYLCEWCLGC